MTNLSGALREKLETDYAFTPAVELLERADFED